MLNKVFYPYYPRVQWLYNYEFSVEKRQCTEITGGWELCNGVPASTSTHLAETDLIPGQYGMFFRVKTEAPGAVRYYGVATQNPINTARYRKLNVQFISLSGLVSRLQFYLTTKKTYPSYTDNAVNHVGGAGITLAISETEAPGDTSQQLIREGQSQLFTANLPSTSIDSKYYLVLMVNYNTRRTSLRWAYNQIYLTK